MIDQPLFDTDTDPLEPYLREMDGLGKEIATARQHLWLLMGRASVLAVEACDAGVAETEASRRMGLDRMTIRRYRGKQ